MERPLGAPGRRAPAARPDPHVVAWPRHRAPLQSGDADPLLSPAAPTRLRLYSDADLALTEAMETDPAVMRELGGAVPREEIPALHRRRLATVADDPWWFVIVGDDDRGVGEIGIWETEHDGRVVHETGWMILAAFHGRGLASAALALLLERAREEPRFEQLHAWPGLSNAASNALCRKFGFELLGEEDSGYRDARLRVNHWVLTLRSSLPR